MGILAAFMWLFKSLEALLFGPRQSARLSPVNIIGDGLYEYIFESIVLQTRSKLVAIVNDIFSHLSIKAILSQEATYMLQLPHPTMYSDLTDDSMNIYES